MESRRDHLVHQQPNHHRRYVPKDVCLARMVPSARPLSRICCGAVCSVGITVLVYFDFILIPLTLAYFIVFLLNPILKLLEKRPYSGKCTPKEHEKRKDTPDSAAVALYDCYTVGKLPHMAAVLVTLGGFFLLLFLLQAQASEQQPLVVHLYLNVI